MRIVVFGAGYVGTVSAACLAKMGHLVTITDTVPFKVESIRYGYSPIVEPQLDELVGEGVAQGRLSAAPDGTAAVSAADLAMICVGTPSLDNGSVDVRALRRVFQSLASAVGHRSQPLPTVIRSTVLAPLLRQVVAEAAPIQGAAAIQVVLNPEFMRETTAVSDFFHPPFLVVGSDSDEAMDLTLRVYEGIEAPRFKVSLETASMLKYACNAFHTVKIAFANEIDTLAALIGADGPQVMQLLVKDKTLNISPAYLRPGFAFGGSCLPKDLRALESFGRQHDEPLYLLSSVLPSNRHRIEQVLDTLLARPERRLAIIGLSFKLGSDDLRESPYVALTERLVDEGFEVRIYDPDLETERLVGTNRAQVLERLPHLAQMLVGSAAAALAEAEAVVFCKKLLCDQAVRALVPGDATVYDLDCMTEPNQGSSTPSRAAALLA